MDRRIANDLSRFQSFDLVQRAFRLRHGLELNSERTREIISCFIQAQAHFDAAVGAAEAVRPLLLYYGVLSMSRGAILFLDPRKRESTLKPSHGLEAKDWRQVLSCGTERVLELEVVVGTGTFSELLEATGNSATSVTLNADWSVTISETPVTLGMTSAKRIRLDDALSRMDALRFNYRDVTNTNCKCYLGRLNQCEDALAISVAIDPLFGLTSGEEVRRVMQVPDHVQIGPSASDEGHFFVYRLAYPTVGPAPIAPRYEGPDRLLGNAGHLVAPWPNGGYVSPLLRSYLVSYFLGALVRYYPSRWISLIRNLKGDAGLPLLRTAADYVERDFPVQILSALG